MIEIDSGRIANQLLIRAALDLPHFPNDGWFWAASHKDQVKRLIEEFDTVWQDFRDMVQDPLAETAAYPNIRAVKTRLVNHPPLSLNDAVGFCISSEAEPDFDETNLPFLRAIGKTFTSLDRSLTEGMLDTIIRTPLYSADTFISLIIFEGYSTFVRQLHKLTTHQGLQVEFGMLELLVTNHRDTQLFRDLLGYARENKRHFSQTVKKQLGFSV